MKKLLLLFFSAFVTLAALPEKELEKGKLALFGCNFDLAERIFLAQAEKNPSELPPRYYLACAALGNYLTLGERKEAVEKLRTRVIEASDCAIKASREGDAEKTLFAASCFVLRGLYESLNEHQGEALVWLRRAIGQLGKIPRESPYGRDAKMLEAACNLALDSAPGLLGVSLSWLLQPRDPSSGLAEIEEILKEKPIFAPEMRLFLIWAYSYQNAPRQALRHLELFRKTFGATPFSELALIRATIMRGDYPKAFTLATNLFERCRSTRSYNHLAADAACTVGTTALARGETQTAEKWFELAIAYGKNKPRLQALCRLFLGECADLRGEREEALRRYAFVHVSEGASLFLRKRAAALEKQPCRPTKRL